MNAATRTRNTLGFTQREFAKLLGVHWVTVSRWESGKLRPSKYFQSFFSVFRRAACRGESMLAAEKLRQGAPHAMKVLLEAGL